MDYLESRGQMERTLIVFTSDHGEGLGEHLEEDHSRLVYDTTVHVPLILSCPQLDGNPSRVDDITVGLIDVMPTILSLLGVDTDLAMDGVNLVTARVPTDRAIYIEAMAPLLYHGWSSLHGIRRLNEKYIESPHPEYFNLTDDPHELRNLWGQDTQRDARIAGELKQRVSVWPTPEEAAASAGKLKGAVRRDLGALGYVSTVDEHEPTSAVRADPKDMVPLFEILRKSSPAEVAAKSVEMSIARDADAGARRRALILALKALDRLPNAPLHWLALGLAEYRLGRFDEATVTLKLTRESLPPGNQTNDTALLAFSAMAEYKLDHKEAAAEFLAELKSKTADSPAIAEPTVVALLTEAEATVAGK